MIIDIVPPGKPVPSASKQIQSSVNSYMSKAKSSIENTVSSAKSGDMKEKIDPYLQPLYDALEDMIPPVRLREMMEQNIIQIAPLAFMRGRTLNDAVVILDEAQNTTVAQLKMFLTRMGMSTKMIVTGDMTQVDLPRNVRSGLADALEVLHGVKGIGFVQLTQKDIVRHKLVTRIVEAYRSRDAEADRKARQQSDINL